jgi:hypothetical protein
MTGHHTADDPRAGAFHARAGWYFRRGADGSVTIWAAEDGAEITLDAGSWASVVASVSAPGESSATFAAARRLHAGGEP